MAFKSTKKVNVKFADQSIVVGSLAVKRWHGRLDFGLIIIKDSEEIAVANPNGFHFPLYLKFES